MTRGRAAILAAVVAAVVLVCDQLTKLWATNTLTSSSVDAIPNILDFQLVFNRGASFGMLEGASSFFIAVSLVVSAIIIVYMIKRKTHPGIECVSLGAILAGAIGNTIDRIAFGYVIDFLHLSFLDFFVFNIADVALTFGVIIWVIFVLFHPKSPFALNKENDDVTG